ncbi:hypothetical protein LTR28_008354, partial [Elasticomyces elasticus]
MAIFGLAMSAPDGGGRDRGSAHGARTESAEAETETRTTMAMAMAMPTTPAAPAQPQRPSAARITSYHAPFQTRCLSASDPPPSYSSATARPRRPLTPRPTDNGLEPLPAYSCSVRKEGVMMLKVESKTPFEPLREASWRQVYVVLCGTQLAIHRVKNIGFGSRARPAAGAPLKRYTLQHAEVGLAADVDHAVLAPRTRIASLLPASARARAFRKDPRAFDVVKQHVLRLRPETEQILLADASEGEILDWIGCICAAIDIALPIDERSVPRPWTGYRRRRRDRTERVAAALLIDERFRLEQERILRDVYPALAGPAPLDPDADPSSARTESRPADDATPPAENEREVPGENEQEVPEENEQEAPEENEREAE